MNKEAIEKLTTEARISVLENILISKEIVTAEEIKSEINRFIKETVSEEQFNKLKAEDIVF